MEAMSYLKTTMQVSGVVRDDRVAAALASVLLRMPSEMRGQPVAMAATRSLLDLGTRDAVRAVMRQFDSKPEGRELENIHEALARFASDLGFEDAPKPGEDLSKDWGALVQEALPQPAVEARQVGVAIRSTKRTNERNFLT